MIYLYAICTEKNRMYASIQGVNSLCYNCVRLNDVTCHPTHNRYTTNFTIEPSLACAVFDDKGRTYIDLSLLSTSDLLLINSYLYKAESR